MESINSNFCWAHSALGTRTPVYFKSSLSHNDHPDDRALGHRTPLAPARTSARRVGGARTTSGLGRTGAGADGGDSLRADPPPFLPNGSGRTWKVTSGKVKTRFLGGIMEASSEVDERVSVELASMAHALSLPAESYGNDPDIEMAWAMRAMQHAEVYYKLISSVDPQFLKLTKVDDQIYSEFRENFKELKIDVLDPEELKSESAKEKWRPFCLKFDGIVEDFNYGTLLRLDCSKGYTEENTIFAPRIQFFAIEIARNREGYNKAVYVSVQDKGEEDANRGAEGVSSGGEEAKEEAASGEEKEGDVSRGEEEEEKTDKEGDNEKGAKKEVSRGGEASE